MERNHKGYSRYFATGLLGCCYHDTAWRKAARLALRNQNATCFWHAVCEVISEGDVPPYAGFQTLYTEMILHMAPGAFLSSVNPVQAAHIVLGNAALVWPGWIDNTPLPLMVGCVSVVVEAGKPYLHGAILVQPPNGFPQGRGVVFVLLNDNGEKKGHWLPVTQFRPGRKVPITRKEALTLGVAIELLDADEQPQHQLDALGWQVGLSIRHSRDGTKQRVEHMLSQTKISACVGLECLPFSQTREVMTQKTFFFVGTRLMDSGNVHVLRRFPHAGDRAWHQNTLGVWGDKGCIAWQLHPKVVTEMCIDAKAYVYVRIGEIVDGELKIVKSTGGTYLSSGDYNPEFMSRLYTTNGCFSLDAPFDVQGTGSQVYRVFRLRRTGMSALGAIKRKIPFTLEKVIDPSTLRFIPQNLPVYDKKTFPNAKAWLACVFTMLLDQAPQVPALRTALVYCRTEALAALVDDELPAEYDPVANFVTLVRMHEAISGIMQFEGLAKIK